MAPNFAQMMARKKAERLAAEQVGDAESPQEAHADTTPKQGWTLAEVGITPIPSEVDKLKARLTQPTAKVNPFAKFKSATPLVDQAVKDLESGDFTLEDLENDEGPAVTFVGRIPTESQFDDETPATAPVRELPEDLTKQQTQFVNLIDGVYSVIGDPELLGNVIKSIMIELKANPQYMQMVAKDDVRAWVKAMRDSMGLARIKKQEKATKRTGGTGSKSSKGADADMMADLDDLLGGIEL